jgi:hypothetical protein
VNEKPEYDSWFLASSQSRKDPLPVSLVWRTKDGIDIAYSDLENRHLLNILLMVRRIEHQAFLQETDAAGVEVSWAETWANSKPVEWAGLFDEAKRRGGMVSLAAQRIEEGMDEDLFRELFSNG